MLGLDWTPRGSHIYTAERRCSSERAQQKCEFGQNDLIYYYSCQTQCESDACNTGLDDASAMVESEFTDTVESCYTCNFTENSFGEVNGKQDCGDEIFEESTTVQIQTCPKARFY